jgi:hypothetical protein
MIPRKLSISYGDFTNQNDYNKAVNNKDEYD